MTVSQNLEFLQLSESMTQKATMTTEALAAMEAVLTERITIDCSAGGTINMPYDDTNELSNRGVLRAFAVNLTGTVTGGLAFNLIHPDNKHMFYCENNASTVANVKTAAGTGINVDPGTMRLLYCDGTNVIDLAATLVLSTIAHAYDFDISMFGLGVDNQTIARFIIGRDVVLNANFAGAVGAVGVNPTANTTYTVEDDGTQIGSFTVATNGSVSFTTVGGGAPAIAAGSIITVKGPASADATLENLTVQILGRVAYSG